MPERPDGPERKRSDDAQRKDIGSVLPGKEPLSEPSQCEEPDYDPKEQKEHENSPVNNDVHPSVLRTATAKTFFPNGACKNRSINRLTGKTTPS
jgi:hypothetical protein